MGQLQLPKATSLTNNADFLLPIFLQPFIACEHNFHIVSCALRCFSIKKPCRSAIVVNNADGGNRWNGLRMREQTVWMYYIMWLTWPGREFAMREETLRACQSANSELGANRISALHLRLTNLAGCIFAGCRVLDYYCRVCVWIPSRICAHLGANRVCVREKQSHVSLALENRSKESATHQEREWTHAFAIMLSTNYCVIKGFVSRSLTCLARVRLQKYANAAVARKNAYNESWCLFFQTLCVWRRMMRECRGLKPWKFHVVLGGKRERVCKTHFLLCDMVLGV